MITYLERERERGGGGADQSFNSNYWPLTHTERHKQKGREIGFDQRLLTLTLLASFSHREREREGGGGARSEAVDTVWPLIVSGA